MILMSEKMLENRKEAVIIHMLLIAFSGYCHFLKPYFGTEQVSTHEFHHDFTLNAVMML